MSEPMFDLNTEAGRSAALQNNGWLADALTCAGIEAATAVDEALIGDIEHWQPIGILAALERTEDV